MSTTDAPAPPAERMLTTAEAAALTPVNRRTLQRYADAGRIPCVTLPTGHRRFRRSDVLALFPADRP